MDINIAVTDANNITLEVTPTPTQTITIDRGIAGPQGPAGPAGGGATSVSVVSANGLAGTVANPTTTPAITLSTTVTGIVKGNGTALSAATAGTDYAPATSGSSILYGNSAGGFNNVTVGSGLSFAAGTLAATGGSSGDVIGPASSTDKAIVTFDGTTGKLIQNNSGNTIGTTGNTVISVTDNTNAALRITQLGTGNALVVEDSTNPDSTPFVINQNGYVVAGYTNILPIAPGLAYPLVQVQHSIANADYASIGVANWAASNNGSGLQLSKSRSGTIGTYGIVSNGEAIGRVQFNADDGTAFITAARIQAEVDGVPGVGDMPGRLVFSTTADGASSPTERMRIDSAGRVGIGSGSLSGYGVRIEPAITGATGINQVRVAGAAQLDVTGSLNYVATSAATAAASFTLANMRHYLASQGTIGAGSIVTNQYGFAVDTNLIGATNNYGFHGNIASGANRWNLYMQGTADNYMAGSLGIGTTPSTGTSLQVSKTITGATTSFGIVNNGIVQSDVTSSVQGIRSALGTAAATFTTTDLYQIIATQGTFGLNSVVTNQYGFYASSALIGATNNYGFVGSIASGANRWNLYMAGTAANYLGGDTIVNGKIGLGTAASPSYGTAGQVLTSAGSGASPTWDAVSLTTGVSGTLPLVNGGTNATSAPAAMASLMGFTSTATAAGTTTLDNTSSYYQIFTGTTTQTIVLPVTSTLVTGWTFHLCNNSTGVLTVNSSGGNLVILIPAGVTAMCTCIGIALTTAADWESGFTDFTTATGTGSVVLGTSPTVNNPTVTNYVESVVAIGTVTTSNTISLTNGTVQTATLTASTACTFTMPTAVAGKSFILLLKQAATTGNGTATFTGVKWSSTGTPTMTATAGRMDIFTFTSDGTNWYGNAAQGYTP